MKTERPGSESQQHTNTERQRNGERWPTGAEVALRYGDRELENTAGVDWVVELPWRVLNSPSGDGT